MCGLIPTARGQVGGGPTPGIGETFALPPPPDHVWSGFVCLCEVKNKGGKGRSGIKRKEKEGSFGRERGRKGEASVRVSWLVAGVPCGDTVHPSTGTLGRMERAKVTCIVGWTVRNVV